MKVKVVVRGTVEYIGELTMSKKDYATWCDKVDGTKGYAHECVADELIGKIGLRLDNPSDFTSLEVETFESL
ncbi:MAG TPA: hypothetical protein VMH41_16115 [Mycobacteriales bacterium]|nr:hypothetical protein [Mycobacteriales bacterium]